MNQPNETSTELVESPVLIKNEKYFKTILDICDKYQNNEYMKQRVQYHLTQALPGILENECKNHEKRLIRNDALTQEHQQFMQIFLSDNKYFYLSNNGCFYLYDGKHYDHIKEDMINYHLLTAISKDRKLSDWKYRTKINIIKQIKDRHLLKSIPESDTIQNVLSLFHPSIFTEKTQAKYFLTILGDNILKKNNDLIFLIKPKSKKLLMEIDNICYFFTGYSNITQNFVTKYHENYNCNNCRLLKINNTLTVDIWRNIISKYIIDIICVASHYSNRFENSDNYIHNIANNEDFKNYSLFLKNNNQTTIIDNFCSYSIQSSDEISSSPIMSEQNNVLIKSKFSISWRNMHYIWKLYISQFSLPSVIYLNNLKNILKGKYSYDETTDTFYNITSKYLPCVSDFIQFWDTTIIYDSNNISTENEIELDELCLIFKKWCQDNPNIVLSNGNITEQDVLKFINHFFPTIEINNNKYIMNISSTMWDKNGDINNSLIDLQMSYKTKHVNGDNHILISFDEAYDYYYKKYKSNSKFIVSKMYFEKYIYLNLHNFVQFDKFISSSWYV